MRRRVLPPRAQAPVQAFSSAELGRIVEILRPYVTEARVERLEAALAQRTRQVAVVLEDIDKDHNASAVLRTADALGVQEVHVVPGRRGFRLARRVTIGAEKWLDLPRYSSAAEAYASLAARGYQIWAADVHGEVVSLEELPLESKVALVFGNEADGLTAEAAAAAHGRFSVPMGGFAESLNVSVASGIALYDLLMRRRRAGTWRGLEPPDLERLRAVWYTLSVRAAPQLLARAGLRTPVGAGEPLSYVNAEGLVVATVPPAVYDELEA